MRPRFSFKKNATVLTANGQQVGSIERVILSSESKMVTHIVVRKGTL